jgi:hypothetical protein
LSGFAYILATISLCEKKCVRPKSALRANALTLGQGKPVSSSEAVQPMSRQNPPKLHGGGGCNAISRAQEHCPHLAQIRARADRPSATSFDLGPHALQLLARLAQAQKTTLPAWPVLLHALPRAQDVNGW